MSRIFVRNKMFWIDFVDANRRRHRRRVGPTRRVAEEALNATLTKIAREEWCDIREDSKTSFEAFAKIWSARVLPGLKPSTRIRWSGILKNHLLPAFKGALRGIEPGRVAAYVADRVTAAANKGTINRETGVLIHMLRRARQWSDENGQRYLQAYPLEDFRPLDEPPGRTRWLELDEIERLLAECRDPALHSFTIVALNSGMRKGEILSLTRSSIDWKRRTAKLTNTKNNEDRIVHLNETAYEALRNLPARLDNRMFTFSARDLSRAFVAAVERAGIRNFRLHDLRHTFASHQAMAGTPGRALQGLLGHRDGRMTARYSHLSENYLKDATARVQLGAKPATAHTIAPRDAG